MRDDTAIAELDMEQMQAWLEEQHPGLLAGLELFEVSYAEYARAVRAAAPRVIYSASTSREAPSGHLE